MKKVAVLADQFFRNQTKEIEEFYYSEFRESEELIVESLEPEEYELVQYEEIADPMEEIANPIEETVVWSPDASLKFESILEEKPMKKIYSPRKPGGGRAVHQCECGIIFSSNMRLRSHIRVKHTFVPESELLPCGLCDKK